MKIAKVKNRLVLNAVMGLLIYNKTINNVMTREKNWMDDYNEFKLQRNALINNRLSKIVTSSTNIIIGYRILRCIRMVSILDESDKNIAEQKFLLAVEEAGGNGVINMQVRPHRGGYFSVQGDAVLIELG